MQLGAIESIFSILSIKDNHAPPTINLKNPDDDCDLDFVANSSRKFEINTAMNNSFWIWWNKFNTNFSLYLISVE